MIHSSKKKVLLIILVTALILLIGVPNFSLFKSSERATFDNLELRIPDISLAKSFGLPICEVTAEKINQINPIDYKKANRGVKFLEKELIINFNQDNLQNIINSILKNTYKDKTNKKVCLPPLLISANLGKKITGTDLSLNSQMLTCTEEQAYLGNFPLTDSLMTYATYLKDNKVINKLNKRIKSLKLKQKNTNLDKQTQSLNQNIQQFNLARNTAKFYVKHSDKLVTLYETLCLKVLAPEDVKEEPEDPETPTDCQGSAEQSCNISNGLGLQVRTCNDYTWTPFGSCKVVSCNTGYLISGNSCVESNDNQELVSPAILSPTSNQVFPEGTTSVKFLWQDNGDNYLVRYQELSSDNTPIAGTQRQINNQATNSYPIPVSNNKRYMAWVHTGTLDNYSSPHTFVYFLVAAPNSCSGATTQVCGIENGTGEQTRTCNNGAWSSFSSCTAKSCNTGYQMSGNSCVSNVSSPFNKGDKVELIRNTNFRRTPVLTGELIRQLPTGTIGKIVGDSAIKNDTVTWRQVDFGLGEISYAGEDNFKIHQPNLTCINGQTEQRTIFSEPQVNKGQTCLSESQTWTCNNNEWSRTSGSFLYTNCYVNGELPVSVASYGPNGTHWPNLIETPFLYSSTQNDIEVEPTWFAISNAIGKITDQQVAQGVRILIKPGTLVGFGAGLEALSVLKNLGKSTWTKRILVAPRDGYGTVIISGGFKFLNIKKIAFAGLYGTAGFYCIDCDQSALAWTRLNGYSAIHAQQSGSSTAKFELSEVAWLSPKVTSSDVLQLISNSGHLKGFQFQGLWMPPNYYEKDFLKKYPTKNDVPHMDTLQIYRVNGGTYKGINLTIKDSVIFASNNAALQTGGTDGIILDHTLLIGGELSKNRYSPIPIGGEDSSIFPAMNGQGSNWEVKNSYIYAGIEITNDGRFSAQPFSKVSNSRISTSLTAIRTPQSGNWILDQNINNYSNQLRPNITDAYLSEIWKKPK